MDEHKLSPPRIICAANRYADDIIIPSARHWDPLMTKLIVALDLTEQYGQQGFIDQHRNFYSRVEAMKIVKANGQPCDLSRCGGNGLELYSEGLY